MSRNVGGKEAVIVNARHSCIVLGEEERAVIAENKGDESISKYIRESIMLRAKPKMGEYSESKKMKEEILKLSRELNTLRKQEAKRIKVSEEQLAYIGQSYQRWEDTTGLINQHSRMGWAQGCTKGLKISAEEALAYLQAEGAFTL